jgi:hypothetical protein
VRKFNQSQRVALRLGDDPVADCRIKTAGNNRCEEVAGIGRGQAADNQSRNPL